MRRDVLVLKLVTWLTCSLLLATSPAFADDSWAASSDHVLDVLTFNAALLPSAVAATNQAERVTQMAPSLLGYDVLVLQELFVDAWREALLADLSPNYPYRTDLVGRDRARGNPFRQDGGIVILSRWPIERQAQMTFDDVCSGTDCLGDKGVSYAAVRKGDQLFHVFGTHAQSEYGSNAESVRARQFELFREFVTAQQIPEDEAVILAGDFNVVAESPELATMLDLLRAVRPVTTGSLRYTWDPERNAFAYEEQQWLDYVLYSADHAQPRAAWNRVVPLRAGNLDLSDHFAVWGRVVMEDARTGSRR
ncbi:MAG: sphingomyelin phosphodiesterase [Trueperaceae bacterium]|nr:sphingomyelin phosphodiesterase [Trueperaceae bacterium]